MIWADREAPTLDDLEALARACFEQLPQEFRALCDGIAMRVEDLPDEELCAELGLDSPFDLSGLYQGVDLTRRGTGDVGDLPDMIFLYRRPILDEWAEGGVTLTELLTHILVHEIGHHFGLSDEAMHEIEEREE